MCAFSLLVSWIFQKRSAHTYTHQQKWTTNTFCTIVKKQIKKERFFINFYVVVQLFDFDLIDLKFDFAGFSILLPQFHNLKTLSFLIFFNCLTKMSINFFFIIWCNRTFAETFFVLKNILFFTFFINKKFIYYKRFVLLLLL